MKKLTLFIMSVAEGHFLAFSQACRWNADLSWSHQVFWNSGNLPAGIYCSRLQAGNQLISEKVIKIN
jgi:hypothetical protein